MKAGETPDAYIETGTTRGGQVMLRATFRRPWWIRWLPSRVVDMTMPPATARQVAAALNQAAAAALHRRGQ